MAARSPAPAASEGLLVPGDLLVLGWREWLALPALGLPAVRAKVDTGAATSALHAHDLELAEAEGQTVARFVTHPYFARRRGTAVRCEAPVVDRRTVRSSSGHEDERVVVRLRLRMGLRVDAPAWDAEVTLADRRGMRFPMLLGREAMAGRILVQPAGSYLLGRLDDPPALYGR
ncbi:MAG: ATP-dependent zinc protease [Rubricoccaceae bacterium]